MKNHKEKLVQYIITNLGSFKANIDEFNNYTLSWAPENNNASKRLAFFLNSNNFRPEIVMLEVYLGDRKYMFTLTEPAIVDFMKKLRHDFENLDAETVLQFI